jgi:hypothetical protein
MEQELRNLIGKYGFKALHEGLLKEMRQTYQYLSTVFPPAKNDIVVPMLDDTIPEPITTPKHSPLTAIVAMKELSLPAPVLSSTEEEQDIKTVLVEEPKDPNIKEVQVTAKGAEKVVTKRRFDKEEQKEAVQKKRAELEAKGIQPMTLLTKENLQSWLGQGMSYQRIAREFVGVPENEVSAIAKTFGLQSQISKFMHTQKKSG